MIIISNVLQITESVVSDIINHHTDVVIAIRTSKRACYNRPFYSGRCGKEIENGTKIIEK